MSKQKDLEDTFNKMNSSELIEYRTAAIASNYVINFIGISTILYMLVFTSIFSIVIGGTIVYIFSNMACVLGEIIPYIEERLKRAQKRKSDDEE